MDDRPGTRRTPALYGVTDPATTRMGALRLPRLLYTDRAQDVCDPQAELAASTTVAAVVGVEAAHEET